MNEIPKILTWPKAITFLLLVSACLSLLILSVTAIFVQRDISHPESMVPWAVSKIANSQPLYDDWRQWPHRFMPYGPMLTYPIGLAMRALQHQAIDFHLYLAGRIQAVLYMLGTCVLMGFILVKLGFRKPWAFTYAGAWMALWSGIVIPTISFRADFPGLFWAMAAAYAGFSQPSTPRNRYLAMSCFGISIAYKPFYWAFPASYCLYLWWQYGFRRGFTWGAALIAAIAIYAITGQLLTNNLFLLNQVGASSMGLTLQLFIIIKQVLLAPGHGVPMISFDYCIRILLAVIAAAAFLRRPTSPMLRGISLYFLVAFILNTVTLFKVGSGLNYLLETYTLAGIVLGASILHFSSRLPSLPTAPRITGIAVLLLLFALPSAYVTFKNFEAAISTWKSRHILHTQAELLALPSTALLGDQAYTHPADSTHALSDPVPYAHLAKKGLIPREPLADRIAARAFSHFIMSPALKYLFFAPDKAPWVGELLQQYYTPSVVIPEYEVWIPIALETGETTQSAVASPIE